MDNFAISSLKTVLISLIFLQVWDGLRDSLDETQSLEELPWLQLSGLSSEPQLDVIAEDMCSNGVKSFGNFPCSDL